MNRYLISISIFCRRHLGMYFFEWNEPSFIETPTMFPSEGIVRNWMFTWFTFTAHISVHKKTYLNYLHIHLYAYIHIHPSIHPSIHTYIHTYAYALIRMHIHMHHMHTHTRVYIYIYIYIWSSVAQSVCERAVSLMATQVRIQGPVLISDKTSYHS